MALTTRRDPGRQAYVITPSDSTIISETRGIYVAVGGDLNVLMAEDTVAVVFPSVPAGVVLPLACIKVLSTSTTASGIIGVR